MTPHELIQLKAFARQYGLFMGLFWIASFACFICQTTPFITFLFDITIFLIPVVAAFFLRNYRDNILGGRISLLRGFVFLMMIFFYATLILAIGQWAYFEYLDNGRLITTITNRLNDPEFVTAIGKMGMKKEEMLTGIRSIGDVRPIDFAFSFMWMNIVVGAVISWVTALMMRRTA